jgi:hypothetical protein
MSLTRRATLQEKNAFVLTANEKCEDIDEENQPTAIT